MTDTFDPTAPPTGTPLLTVGAWSLWQRNEHTPQPATEHFIALVEALFPHVVAEIQGHGPLPDGVQGHVFLAGEQSCLDWNVDEAALGFQGIMANDTGDGDPAASFPDDHRCYLNLDALVQAAQDDGNDAFSWASSLVTLPHEMAHVTLFARHTKGKTPRQIHDERGIDGVLGVQLLLEEEAHQVDEHSAEDLVERWADECVCRWKGAITPWAPPAPMPERTRAKP